jgi:hypothetical protein
MTVHDLIHKNRLIRKQAGALLSTLLLLALPLAAWADDDEKITVDPKTAAQSNQIIGAILLVACLGVVWYYFRRWQITRSGNQVHGTNRNQD